MLAMNAPTPISPRGRLQALVAIPERERTDSQWDEMNELEIQLACANREQALEQDARGNTPVTGSGHAEHGGAQRKKPFQKLSKGGSKEHLP